MHKLFFIFSLLFFTNGFCQKIDLSKVKNFDTDKLVKYLAKKITYCYSEKDKATYYDNIFRVNIINEDYDLSLAQLDSVRYIYKASHPYVSLAMGTQYEVYIKSKKNKSTYEEEFRLKYGKLPIRSQILLPQYFSTNIKNTENNISEILQKKISDDSISVKEALLLCRNYISLKVAEETFAAANDLLKKMDKENFIIHDSITLTTADAGEVSLTAVISNKNKTPAATILINTIYSDQSNIITAKEYAQKGYACVILNSRGKFFSKSKIEPFEHEAQDLNHAIEWITKQKWSNGKVGMIGGSYSGFSALAAAKQLHPALKTIVPQAAVGIGAMDFPMNNNIFSSYALRWITYVTSGKMTDYSVFDEKKWNAVYKRWYESGRSFRELDSASGNKNEIFQRWLNHPLQDSYWQNMVPRNREFSKISIPVLTITGYYDSDQLGALYYLRQHYKNNSAANHYLIIGPYDHSGAQGNIKSNLRGYSIDDTAKIDLDKISVEWFDYILKEKPKPSFLKDKMNYQVMGTNEWKSTDSIEEFDKNKVKFFLRKSEGNNILSDYQKNDKELPFLKVDYGKRDDADELLSLKYDLIENQLYNKNNLIFSSEPFKNSFEFTGNFAGKLKFSVNKKDVDLYVYLYELMPDGKYFLLSTYLGRASHSKSWKKRKLLHPGKKEVLVIKNNEFVSKEIKKGSKLVAVIGVNKSPLYQINYGTGKEVSDENIQDAKEPLDLQIYGDSYIEMPFIK